MQLSFAFSVLATAVFAGLSVRAEQHTIRFDNKCGKGTPQLIQGGTVLSTGQDFTSNGPFSAGIAYLQTGGCGFNGEECTLLEMTLVNPTSPGAGSSTDISLIAPHAFNVETSFSYFGGCDGQGASCDSGSCKSAFFQPNDNQVQVQCETNDVNLLITFCGTSAALTNNSTGSSKPLSSAAIVHSSSAAAAPSTHTAAAPSSAAPSSAAPSSVTVPANVESQSAAPSSAAASASASAASPSGSSSRCSTGSRRRRSVEASAQLGARAAPGHNMRRHRARNAEAAGGHVF